MRINNVRESSTTSSSTQFTVNVTISIYHDLENKSETEFNTELGAAVRKAVAGIYEFNIVPAPEKVQILCSCGKIHSSETKRGKRK